MCHKGEPVIRQADEQATRIGVNGRAGLCFRVGRVKVRAIDPPILIDGELRPLSELDPAFAGQRAAHIAARELPRRLFVSRADQGDPQATERVA